MLLWENRCRVPSFPCRPKHVESALRSASLRRIAQSSHQARVRCAVILTRSVLAFGSAPHAASGPALAWRPASANHASRRLRRADSTGRKEKDDIMSTTTTHNSITTNNAGFPPAPSEAHQRSVWVQIAQSELDKHCLSGEFFISPSALESLSVSGTTLFEVLSWFNTFPKSVIVGETHPMCFGLQAYFGFNSGKPNRLCFFVQIDFIPTN